MKTHPFGEKDLCLSKTRPWVPKKTSQKHTAVGTQKTNKHIEAAIPAPLSFVSPVRAAATPCSAYRGPKLWPVTVTRISRDGLWYSPEKGRKRKPSRASRGLASQTPTQTHPPRKEPDNLKKKKEKMKTARKEPAQGTATGERTDMSGV